ncbi:MAG: peptidoglycan recognition family protein [bacterium]
MINKFLYVIIFLLLLITIIFSYKVKDYRFSLYPDNNTTLENTEKIDLISRPVIFDAQRKFLTALYREKHTGDCDHEKNGMDSCLLINPKIIILHMTDLDDLEKSFEYMKEPVLREEREKLISRSYDRLNVSAQYLVDKDGSIYLLMPDNNMARHAMGVNHLSIAIENVGMNQKGPSREQIDSNVKLVRYLMKKYKIGIDSIYSHADIGMLREKHSNYYVELEENYFIQKNCGEKLIKAVKKRLNNL